MSLTPASREAEATQEAFYEGCINGALTLIPSSSAVYFAMKNPGFVKRTNVQSRTAMIIMPALFVFGLTSETRLTSKMHEIATQTQHTSRTVEWAERQAKSSGYHHPHVSRETHEMHLSSLYQQSIDQTGVRVVPGDALGLHHRALNYLQANPIKILASLALPSVGYILYGRSGKQHLDFSVKLLHTRVFGQFATISLLLSVMGFKEFMDRNGRFITEAERDARIEEMRQVRLELLERLEEEQRNELELKAAIEAAREKDMKEGKESHYKTSHQHHQNNKPVKHSAA